MTGDGSVSEGSVVSAPFAVGVGRFSPSIGCLSRAVGVVADECASKGASLRLDSPQAMHRAPNRPARASCKLGREKMMGAPG